MLDNTNIDVDCVQETRWMGSGCRFFGAVGKRYKLFRCGYHEKTEGAGVFVAEKCVDQVIQIHSYREL